MAASVWEISFERYAFRFIAQSIAGKRGAERRPIGWLSGGLWYSVTLDAYQKDVLIFRERTIGGAEVSCVPYSNFRRLAVSLASHRLWTPWLCHRFFAWPLS